ncbi:hypothetical protein [Silvibacterium acidisoli]|uniref:hypothetical protein n=1 Tax=Acidobacteriaceae bacterium ZG23-2 TaxID=2883246 RepID=UPI00406C0A13
MFGFFLVFALSAFSALWCLLCYLISYLSGWMKLSNHFAADRSFTFSGERVRFCSGSMLRHIQYRGILEVGCNEDGLHLALIWPFRISHPRLIIPWGEIAIGEPEKRFGIFTVTPLLLGRTLQTPFTVYTGRARQLIEKWVAEVAP